MISVEQAIQTITDHIQPLGLERSDILNSLGRVLAEDIYAPYDVPPFDNSAMDGYAVKYSDITNCSPENPAVLHVTGDIPAGFHAAEPLKKRAAYRIMTGAPIPEGADTVVMQEDTRKEGASVVILKAQTSGSHIRKAGEDIKKGAKLFSSGTKLGPAQIGILASIKKACVSIYQKPRVAILSTGDELVDIDDDLSTGKIVTSNSYSLASLVKQSGAVPVILGIAKDKKEDLKEKINNALHADIIISSGGVSVGDYDFVKEVLADLGVEMKFWKVAMRPGQPLAFGIIAGKPTFGLPGNPVSVMVSFEQFVRPSIRKMTGHKKLFRPIITAIAKEKITTSKGKKYFIRCHVQQQENTWYASSTGMQGSGILMSMAEANGLMIIPEMQESVNPGDKVKIQLLDEEAGFTETPAY